jgi:hypothetical protein
MEIAVQKLALINSRIADIMTEPRLDPIRELPFIVWAVCELLFTLTVRNVIFPVAVIFVTLKGIMVYTHPMCLIILNISLIQTPIIVEVATFSMCDAIFEGAKVIWAIFKVKLALSIELVIGPLSMIVALGYFYLLISVAEHSMYYFFGF